MPWRPAGFEKLDELKSRPEDEKQSLKSLVSLGQDRNQRAISGNWKTQAQADMIYLPCVHARPQGDSE